jgi:hypothetical protein
MGATSAVALFAALAFVAAGCASGSKLGSGSATVKTGTVVRSKAFSNSLTVSGTVTISNVKTGTTVRCRGSFLTAKVPRRSEGIVEGGSSNGARSRELKVTHLQSGAVTVSCSR